MKQCSTLFHLNIDKIHLARHLERRWLTCKPPESKPEGQMQSIWISRRYKSNPNYFYRQILPLQGTILRDGSTSQISYYDICSAQDDSGGSFAEILILPRQAKTPQIVIQKGTAAGVFAAIPFFIHLLFSL